MHELIHAGHVAGRNHARVGRAHVVVDLHTARIVGDARNIESEALDVRPAPKGRKNILSLDRKLPVHRFGQNTFAATVTLHAVYQSTGVHPDAVGLE